jgi:DNA-binding NtrC family response regulator
MTGAKMNGMPASLAGKTVLVVEDRYLIARDMCRAIRELGGAPLAPAGDLASARDAISRTAPDLVLVDMNLRDEMASPLVHELRDKGIPFILATGYEDWMLPADIRGSPRVEKPVTARTLRHVVEGLQL